MPIAAPLFSLEPPHQSIFDGRKGPLPFPKQSGHNNVRAIGVVIRHSSWTPLNTLSPQRQDRFIPMEASNLCSLPEMLVLVGSSVWRNSIAFLDPTYGTGAHYCRCSKEEGSIHSCFQYDPKTHPNKLFHGRLCSDPMMMDQYRIGGTIPCVTE